MFYNTIKKILIKKRLNLTLANALPIATNDAIKTIGILIDETVFFEKEKLINAFKKHANGQFKVNILVYRKKPKKNEIVDYPFYTTSDISFSGDIKKGEVENFIKYPFDLLVSYYDVSNIDLEVVTINSKAKFKTGFATINNAMNHFFVTTHVEKYDDFTEVLFNYLKILNKI